MVAIIYILGFKVLSFRLKKDNNKCMGGGELNPYSKRYQELFDRRFKGLTHEEIKYTMIENIRVRSGYKADLDNPKTFNEKINWLKLYWHDPIQTICADKIAVRDFVKDKIGEKYLTPIIGTYKNVDEIDFDKLPDKFVVKSNWGSGQNIICKDKSALNIEETKQIIKEWLKPEGNHYFWAFEWCYKDIKPAIIVENYLESISKSALDYKFLCFMGKPYYCWVSNKYKDIQERSFYDMNWVMQDIELIEWHKMKPEIPVPKPENFDEMISIATTLCQGFPHVRVDLYRLDDGTLKFGELTFNTLSGYGKWTPKGVDRKLGDLIDLTNVKKYEIENN